MRLRSYGISNLVLFPFDSCHGTEVGRLIDYVSTDSHCCAKTVLINDLLLLQLRSVNFDAMLNM